MKIKSILLLSLTAIIFSCTKNNDDSMREYLYGNWRLVQVGADTNGNQIMEPAELIALPDTGIISTVFNYDGTGSGSFNLNKTLGVNAKFQWTTDERAQILMIHSDDSMTYHANFKAIDSRNFYLLNNDVSLLGSKIWLVYNRE